MADGTAILDQAGDPQRGGRPIRAPVI